MSLSASLSNALSGMNVSQNSLEVLSRNVSNAGTPGYHKQSLSVIDSVAGNSSYARSGQVERAFNKSLQVHYTNAVSNASYASTLASGLDRLQSYLGKPGDAGSLDTMFGSLQNAFQALSTSPDNYATRATTVSQAQAMATTLNSLTRDVQGLRQEAETQISSTVDQLNIAITGLQKINERLGDLAGDEGSRAALMDQRDRLVSQVSELVDVRVDYRGDGTVALMTRSGLGLLDGRSASTFSFTPVGAISAEKQFSPDPAQSGVGRLELTMLSGTKINLGGQGIIQSGKLGALLDLRDNTLVSAQGQLDEIAAGLAQAMSTVQTAGSAASSGAQNGYSLDLGSVRDGNDFILNYSSGGSPKSIKVVRVDDLTKLPLDYQDATGTRVIGMDFSGGATAIASALQPVLGSGFTLSGSGSVLTVLDDGAGDSTDVMGLTARTTSTALQNGTPALNLFVDRNDADFTNSLAVAGQKLGFAGRIGVNSALLADNTLLVKSLPTSSLGDPARADYLLDQLQTMGFATGQSSGSGPGYRLAGTVSDLISQTMDGVGNAAAMASSDDDTQQMAMESLTQRMDAEYGVNVDEEMARLMELQNAYAANSRVIAVVQELMNRLMEI